jgi:arylsulfatase A-like enzyme
MSIVLGYVAMLAAASVINKHLKLSALGVDPWGRQAWCDCILVEIKVALAALAVMAALALLPLASLSAAWHAAVMLAGVLVAAEAYYYQRTGSNGDAFLLKRIFRQRADLVLIVRERGTRGVLVVLLIAAALVGAWHLGGAWRLVISAQDAALLALGAGLSALVLHLGRPDGPVDSSMHPWRRSAIWALVRDFFGKPAWYTVPVAARARALGAPRGAAERAEEASGPATRENVLLLVMESARGFQHLPPQTLPFVESLARGGCRVPNCYSVVPHTTAAMVPLLAGVYPPLDRHPKLHATMPAVLAAHGYGTAFFTPAALEFEDKGQLLADMGFEHLVGARELKGSAGAPPHYLGFHDEHVIPPLLAWMELQAREQRPFLATCLTLSSHHPYSFPAQGDEALLANAEEHEQYFAALRYTDRCIQHIVNGVDALGLRDQTWIVVVGDHGQAFGEHGRRYHSACLWEEGLSVPCVIAPPVGREMPATIEGVRSQLDLAPTLLAELGLSVPDHYPGSSLRRPSPPDRELFHATWLENQSLCLRRGTLKYLYHHEQAPAELYDVATDPFEHSNLLERLDDSARAKLAQDCLVWRHRLELPTAAKPDARAATHGGTIISVTDAD